jgi:GT2 family glycosyltransferase
MMKADQEEWVKNGTPKIGVLIPTFNRMNSLNNCLQSLKKQDFTDAQAQLLPIVIVDGSTDGTLEMLGRDFPEAVVVNGDGNWWYTKCINEGIKTAVRLNCDFILTLNDDIDFAPGYVNNLLRDHYACGAESVIGSVSLSAGLPSLITFSGVSKVGPLLKESNYIPKFSVVEEKNLSGVRPSVVLSGRGILYPAEIFVKQGLYDEKLVQYSAETDFTYNASRQGIPVMISYNARVYENLKLTSDGAVYNNPSLKTLFKSFNNKYSINSFRKTWYYSIKHRGPVLGSLTAVIRMMGILKNFILGKFKSNL